MTDFNVELRNPEGTEVLQAALIHPTDAATAQPAILNQVSPKGTITAGALPTVQLVSGTGAQVSTTRDVDTYTLWTGDATNNVASAAVAISPDNVTYTTVYTASLAAAVNNTGAIAIPLYARVPAGWYLKITSVHGAALPTTAYY
jgi:hypothetical protein